MNNVRQISQRELWLRIWATILGVAASALLVTATARLVLLDCPMSVIEPLSWEGLGLFVLSIDAWVLVAIGKGSRRWKRVGTVLAAIAVGVVFFFAVAVPWSSEQRIARHQKLMMNRVPALNTIVASVEESRAETGKIPADENEFLRLIDDSHLNLADDLPCCWGMEYNRSDSTHYDLRYIAMDVEYVYESRNATRGWHAVELSK